MPNALKNTGRRIKQGLTNTPQAIINPRFVATRVEEASTIGQWIAAALLFVIVPVSVIVFRLFHDMLITLFLRRELAQEDGVPFYVTAVTLIFLIVMDWFWFQWVRTAGFGYLNVRLRRD